MKTAILAAAILLMSGMAHANEATGEIPMPAAEENFSAQAAEQDYLMIDKHLVAVDLQALLDDGAQGLVFPGRGHGGGHGGGWGHGRGGGWGHGRGGGWGHGRGGWGGWRWRHGDRGWGRRGWWYKGWGRYPGYACYSRDFDGYTYAGNSSGSAMYNCRSNSASQGCSFLGCD